MTIDRARGAADDRATADLGADVDDAARELPRIDWASVDRPAATPPIDRSSDRVDPGDRPAGLLAADAPLDPARDRVPVSDLHPDRLEPTGPSELADLRARAAIDPDPEAWVDRVNPGFLDDLVAGRPGRTENCAECARAFQATLDGRPTVAGAIDAAGLPTVGAPIEGGEAIDYTEQWAGRRSEALDWGQIEHRVAEGGGSAIVFAWGPEGGHAFNAYADALGRVRWADAQVGETGGWPPDDLRARFPKTRAIVFDRGGNR